LITPASFLLITQSLPIWAELLGSKSDLACFLAFQLVKGLLEILDSKDICDLIVIESRSAVNAQHSDERPVREAKNKKGRYHSFDVDFPAVEVSHSPGKAMRLGKGANDLFIPGCQFTTGAHHLASNLP